MAGNHPPRRTSTSQARQAEVQQQALRGPDAVSVGAGPSARRRPAERDGVQAKLIRSDWRTPSIAHGSRILEKGIGPGGAAQDTAVPGPLEGDRLAGTFGSIVPSLPAYNKGPPGSPRPGPTIDPVTRSSSPSTRARRGSRGAPPTGSWPGPPGESAAFGSRPGRLGDQPGASSNLRGPGRQISLQINQEAHPAQDHLIPSPSSRLAGTRAAQRKVTSSS